MPRGDRRDGGGGRSRGQGRGSSGGSGQPRDIAVSKKLSWLLRHGAEKEGLRLGQGAYANLADVLSNRLIKSLDPKLTLPELKALVAANEKQRFSLIHISSLPASDQRSTLTSTSTSNSTSNSTSTPISNTISTSTPTSTSTSTNPPLPPSASDISTDPNPAHYLIRANQGHSLKLTDEHTASLLQPLSLSDPSGIPAVVVHGTRAELWPAISRAGLKPMSRNHVHFATGVPGHLRSAWAQERLKTRSATEERAMDERATEEQNITDGHDERLEEKQQVGTAVQGEEQRVLSGMRNSSTMLIFVDVRRAMAQGVKFWRSENGVLLSDGGEKGVVGTEFFERVEVKGREEPLMVDGKVVA